MCENAELTPLKEWYCDECGEIIESPEDGWLEWYQDVENRVFEKADKGFRIVHRVKCIYDSNRMFEDGKSVSDTDLTRFTGSDGLSYLISFVEYNRFENNKEFAEIFKRIHIPYYEEARKYFYIAESEGEFHGENELTRTQQYTLKRVIERYKDMK